MVARSAIASVFCVANTFALEAEVKNCDDGTHHCADANPICCWNGSAIAFCCDVAHPVCHLSEHKCYSQFEEAMMAGSSPAPIAISEATLEAEAEAEVKNCDDGTHHCADANPICCWNGSAIAFCCDVAHPVCHLSEHKCYSQFEEAMMAGSSPEPIVTPEVKLEAEVKNCDDGTHHCADANPICCMNGHAIAFCCDIAHPICHLSEHKCYSQFEEAMMTGRSPEPMMPAAVEAKLEAEVKNCDDGTHHCADATPICCMNGHAIAFCCDIAHPVCHLSEGKCYSQFEEAMMTGSSPELIATSEAKLEAETKVTNCDDGTHHCADANPICCMNGHAIAFCCDIAHPICHLSEHKCYSQFEEAMMAGSSPEPIVASEEVKLEAEVKNCDDGTHHCADATPICCMNGHAIAFCCDIAHPVCHLSEHKCYSQFEEAMMAGSEPKTLLAAEAKPEKEVKNSCDDGTHHCNDDHPVCCWNGSAIAFCCDVAHPVCHLSEHKCYSRFEEAMIGTAPGSVTSMMV